MKSDDTHCTHEKLGDMPQAEAHDTPSQEYEPRNQRRTILKTLCTAPMVYKTV
uniref:Uncharacterized protein n=1 Tax=Arundo donax TaxID=35708 RepID=A0A0A8Y424_ARUDO